MKQDRIKQFVRLHKIIIVILELLSQYNVVHHCSRVALTRSGVAEMDGGRGIGMRLHLQPRCHGSANDVEKLARYK